VGEPDESMLSATRNPVLIIERHSVLGSQLGRIGSYVAVCPFRFFNVMSRSDVRAADLCRRRAPHLWSERYGPRQAQRFAIQVEIGQAISELDSSVSVSILPLK
jgi:hypothetical protein